MTTPEIAAPLNPTPLIPAVEIDVTPSGIVTVPVQLVWPVTALLEMVKVPLVPQDGVKVV